MFLAASALPVSAEPAAQVLGRDFVFPQRIEGVPAKLSDFAGLQINTFITNDGIKLAYWETGSGGGLRGPADLDLLARRLVGEGTR